MSAPRKRTNEEILASGASLTCSIPEAAQLLGVDRRSIEDMIAAGTLHAFDVGRRKKVGVASLRRVAGDVAA